MRSTLRLNPFLLPRVNDVRGPICPIKGTHLSSAELPRIIVGSTYLQHWLACIKLAVVYWPQDRRRISVSTGLNLWPKQVQDGHKRIILGDLKLNHPENAPILKFILCCQRQTLVAQNLLGYR